MYFTLKQRWARTTAAGSGYTNVQSGPDPTPWTVAIGPETNVRFGAEPATLDAYFFAYNGSGNAEGSINGQSVQLRARNR